MRKVEFFAASLAESGAAAYLTMLTRRLPATLLPRANNRTRVGEINEVRPSASPSPLELEAVSAMKIRTFIPGDDAAQVGVFNEAAAALPKFKPATLDEVRRRCHAPDFDPATRFYAEENGLVVGYATFQTTGRVSYPWTRAGHEKVIQPLFDA